MRGIVETRVDVAGGKIQPLIYKVRIGTNPLGVVGSPVDGHPPCPDVPVHCAPNMAEGNPNIRVGDIPVCFEGHKASCGHAASGRPKIRMG